MCTLCILLKYDNLAYWEWNAEFIAEVLSYSWCAQRSSFTSDDIQCWINKLPAGLVIHNTCLCVRNPDGNSPFLVRNTACSVWVALGVISCPVCGKMVWEVHGGINMIFTHGTAWAANRSLPKHSTVCGVAFQSISVCFCCTGSMEVHVIRSKKHWRPSVVFYWKGRTESDVKTPLLLGDFDLPPGVTVVKGDWSQLTPSWKDQWVHVSLVNGPPPRVCACLLYVHMRVSEREWERTARAHARARGHRCAAITPRAWRTCRVKSSQEEESSECESGPGAGARLDLGTAPEYEMLCGWFTSCAPAARWVRSPVQVRECYPCDCSPVAICGAAALYISLSTCLPLHWLVRNAVLSSHSSYHDTSKLRKFKRMWSIISF